MSKIHKSALLDNTIDLLKANYPTLNFVSTQLTDENSYFKLIFYLDGLIAIEIKIDLMDRDITFMMVRLTEKNTEFEGYYRNRKGEKIRLDFGLILKYLNIAFDKKKASEILTLPLDFYLKDNCNEFLQHKIKESISFFDPIFANKQLVLFQLQNPFAWEKISD